MEPDNRTKGFTVFALVAISVFLGSARAEVNFLSGSYAELCGVAAEKREPAALYAVTGSKLGLSAIAVCTRAIQSRDGSISNLAESYNNRGVLFFEKSDYVNALIDFDAAIAEQPSLAQAHVNQGYTFAALERWQESVDALSQGIELGTVELAKAHYIRGIAHEEMGNVRQAYQDYIITSELDPEWIEPRQELERFTIRRNE